MIAMNVDKSTGIIVIDKPTGTSSAQVVARVKRLLKVKKIGHTGTLDPFASGVLVCCLNQATKLARFFLKGHKRYDAVLKLGTSTDTQDVTGKVVGQPADVRVSEKALQDAFARFRGAIDQQPPIYSALKHKGKPLYELARSGRPEQKPPRRVQIQTLEIERIELPYVSFTVLCSAGTYIRTLCQDIGDLLGCGGYLHALRRTECSGFALKQAVTLSDLEKEVQTSAASDRIVPMAASLPQMPEGLVSAVTAKKIRQGQPLTEMDLISTSESGTVDWLNGYVKIVDINRELIAIVAHSSSSRRLEYCCVFPN